MKINQSISQARRILRRKKWMFELNRIKTFESELRLKDRDRNRELYEQKKKRKTTSKKEDTIVNIYIINAVSFVRLIKQKDVKIFLMFIRDINIELNKQNKLFIDSKTKISREYHSWLDVFFKWLIDKLSSHKKHDHSIELIDSVQESDHAFLYSMSEEELILVKRYLKKHLNKDFIVINSISFVSFILFVRKSNEELRLCVDVKKLNAIIKKNRYSLLFINELMTRLFKTKYLTKINIRHAFNRIRMIIEANENLITFRIRFEFYKYRILSFEFINESITFQNFINDIFMKYLNEFVVTYLNDILVYNNSLKEHREHVKKMLQKFRDTEIQIDIDKCEFHTTETKFLEVIVERNDICMNSKKIAAIVEWAISIHLKQVQVFLEFINFYRRFIKNFCRVIRSLIQLTKKDKSFEWTFVCQRTFDELKKRITKVSILAHFDYVTVMPWIRVIEAPTSILLHLPYPGTFRLGRQVHSI
jgi:hypothetical protein